VIVSDDKQTPPGLAGAFADAGALRAGDGGRNRLSAPR